MTRNHTLLERYLGLQKTETILVNTLRRSRYCESVTIVGVNRPIDLAQNLQTFSVLPFFFFLFFLQKKVEDGQKTLSCFKNFATITCQQ